MSRQALIKLAAALIPRDINWYDAPNALRDNVGMSPCGNDVHFEKPEPIQKPLQDNLRHGEISRADLVEAKSYGETEAIVHDVQRIAMEQASPQRMSQLVAYHQKLGGHGECP